MTAPAPAPAPGAPATDPSAPATPPSAVVDPATPPAPALPAPLHEDPAIAKALEGLTAEQRETLLTQGGKNALAARAQEAKDAKAAAVTAAETATREIAEKIGKALGIVPDGTPPDPAALAEQVATSASEAKTAKRELAIYQAAALANADAAALLDSRSFMTKTAELEPTDLVGITAAITEALAANPTLATQPARRLPAPSPAPGSSGGGAPDLEAQIAAATKAGDTRTVIALQNQKLTAPQR